MPHESDYYDQVNKANPGQGFLSELNRFSKKATRDSVGRSFFSPQFELLSAFKERNIDAEFGRPRKQEGALANLPGFMSDLFTRFRDNPTAEDFGNSGFTLQNFGRPFPGDRGPRNTQFEGARNALGQNDGTGRQFTIEDYRQLLSAPRR